MCFSNPASLNYRLNIPSFQANRSKTINMANLTHPLSYNSPEKQEGQGEFALPFLFFRFSPLSLGRSRSIPERSVGWVGGEGLQVFKICA